MEESAFWAEGIFQQSSRQEGGWLLKKLRETGRIMINKGEHGMSWNLGGNRECQLTQVTEERDKRWYSWKTEFKQQNHLIWQGFTIISLADWWRMRGKRTHGWQMRKLTGGWSGFSREMVAWHEGWAVEEERSGWPRMQHGKEPKDGLDMEFRLEKTQEGSQVSGLSLCVKSMCIY